MDNVTEEQLDVGRIVIDELAFEAVDGGGMVSPGRLLFILDDICIEQKLAIQVLPSPVLALHREAVWQCDTGKNGGALYNIKKLIEELEQAFGFSG